MKKIIATMILIAASAIAVVYGQPVDPTYWHYKQKKANWLFEHDTVRINCLRIDNKMAIDSLGRIWWYDNSAATAGKIMVGNGTYYSPLSIGTTGQVLTVSGGTAAWTSLTAGGVTGLTADQLLFGSGTGTIDQSSSLSWDGTTLTCLGDGYFDAGLTIGGTSGFSTIFSDEGYITQYRGASIDAGDLLVGEIGGGLFIKLGMGTSNQLLRVNAAGTQLEYFSPTFLTTEVDGSTTNEIQNLSYDATNHEVDISLGGTSATIPLGLDDGATKGLASFTAADFNVTAGNVAIDYANGQAATSGQDGFLQSADWSTFNKKTGLVQAPTELTGQNTSLGPATVYTTPAADGWYRISVTATVTTAAPTTMDIGVQLKYTEATDNVTKTFPNTNVNGYNRTTINTTAASVSISSVCHVKASTAIQYITSWSPTGGGSPAYNLHVTIEKLDY